MSHSEKCPICLGKGKVPAGFYEPTMGTNSESCKSCGGKGWIEVQDSVLPRYPSPFIPPFSPSIPQPPNHTWFSSWCLSSDSTDSTITRL